MGWRTPDCRAGRTADALPLKRARFNIGALRGLSPGVVLRGSYAIWGRPFRQIGINSGNIFARSGRSSFLRDQYAEKP